MRCRVFKLKFLIYTCMILVWETGVTRIALAVDDFSNNAIDESLSPEDKKALELSEKRKKPLEDEAIDDPFKGDKENAYLQPISLDFKGASLREVIRIISAETHINFILPSDLGESKVYVSLKNVPWDQALQAILETNGLGLSKMGGDVIRIDKIETLEKEKQDLTEIRKRAALVTPTQVLVVRLSYAKAGDVAKIITSMLAKSSNDDKRVKVNSDDRTNSVIVETIPQELSKVRSLIERIDLQTPQVRIESRVVEIIKKTNNFLGINWGAPFNYDQGRGLGFGNMVFPNNFISAFSVDTGSTTQAVEAQSGKFDVHVGSINNVTALDLKLRMGELSDQTRSLQNNSVLVVDGQKAKIEAGTEDYFQVPTGQGQSTMSSVTYTLSLEVTPHITADGAVQMLVTIENSSPTKPTLSAVATSKSLRTLTTNLLRKTGETAVIGGLYTTSYQETKQGFPFLKDLPIIGLLFGSTGRQENKRELIILITPTIVSGNDRAPYALKDSSPNEIQKNESQSETPEENINIDYPVKKALPGAGPNSNSMMQMKESKPQAIPSTELKPSTETKTQNTDTKFMNETKTMNMDSKSSGMGSKSSGMKSMNSKPGTDSTMDLGE